MKKRVVRYMTAVLMLTFCIVAAAGCKGKQAASEPSQTKEPQTTESAMPADRETKAPQATDGQDPDQSSKPADEELLELPIYTVDSDSLEKVATVARIPKPDKLTAQIILDTVVEAFHEIGTSIGIDSVTEEGDSVTVSFTKDKAPTYNTGSTMESEILDCIAQSLMDNLESCKKVYYLLEGKAYESGHFLLEPDEPYMTK